MFSTTFKSKRAAVAGALALGVAVAASSVTIARAGHVFPDKSKTFTCSSGTACVEGNSSGSHTWGVYGAGAIGDGVHGVTSSTNGNSGTSGIATGRHVLAYTPESASATIEDVGTARMYDGVANVQISPDFASVIDRSWYYVFLTPLGDTRGLYVSVKTPAAFQVRETLRGRNSLAFDYRIVAHPLGASNDRLPAATRNTRIARFIHPAP